ncbi:MAG TPA: GMP synthase, partial [Cyclobacteriaceae bacterium]|nr:GMP synthase [Cyclobacteriaceae bacterium]
VFLICHSFQIYCRHYNYGKVSKRKSTSFGILPVHKTGEGYFEPLLMKLADPFWAVDSRDFQITEPDLRKIKAGGGALLCIEKFRAHVELERAVMAIRFDDAIVGTQFHPEADVESMRRYLHREDKKSFIIEKHGEEKYQDMLLHLDDTDKIGLTHASIIPGFLQMAVAEKSKTHKV